MNDRGPFVPGRVIDLSFQAAYSLGITDTGTAPVLVEAISTHLPSDTLLAATPATEPLPLLELPASVQNLPTETLPLDPQPVETELYLQLGAFREVQNAQNLASNVGHSLPVPVVIDHYPAEAIYRVWVGPIYNPAERDQTEAALRARGVSQFTVVNSTR